MGRGNGRRFSQKTQGGRESRYGLVGVQRLSRISVDMDKYRRGLIEHRMTGTIVKRSSTRCWIEWDDSNEAAHEYAEADIRYWIDSGRARLTSPVKQTILDAKRKHSD